VCHDYLISSMKDNVKLRFEQRTLRIWSSIPQISVNILHLHKVIGLYNKIIKQLKSVLLEVE